MEKPGYSLYRITNLRHDKHDYPIFILRHMADLPDNLEINFVGNFQDDTYLGLQLLMDSPRMLTKTEEDDHWMQRHQEDFNFQLLCDTINGLKNHPAEPVTVENLTMLFPQVITGGELSFPQVRNILLTPTQAQIETKKQQEAEAEAARQAYEAKVAADLQRKLEERNRVLDFLKNPMVSHTKFPFFVTKWIAYLRREVAENYAGTGLVNDIAMVNMGYISIGTFETFLKKYTDKFYDEVRIGHLKYDAIPDTITDISVDDPLNLRYAEMYLAFDKPRKASKKAAKTAAKRAKKGKTV